jgi:hypothetical protein
MQNFTLGSKIGAAALRETKVEATIYEGRVFTV